jgi:predicted nucleic acid-binding protein
MPAEVFLDTAYAIALSSVRDHYHAIAVQLAARLKAESARLITTRPVLLEIGDALAKPRYRLAAIRLLLALEADPNVEIVPLSDELYQRALQLYSERPDKDWGLTDCISFIVMQARGIHEALTTDEHFQQAGFRVLLHDVPR